MIKYSIRFACVFVVSMQFMTNAISNEIDAATSTTDTEHEQDSADHSMHMTSSTDTDHQLLPMKDTPLVNGESEVNPLVKETEPEMAAANADQKTDDDELSAAGGVVHDINQMNKTFSQTSITVKVGDEVNFINSDSYFHNVYSLSDIAPFDLGSYPKGESRSVVLEKPGTVSARCAIHPQMHLEITVEE